MSRIAISTLLAFLSSAQCALAQSTPTITWDANQPTVDGSFKMVGSGTITRPSAIWSVSATLHAMNTATKRIYSGQCAIAIQDGQLTGTWNGTTQTGLPNGDYEVWVLLIATEGSGPTAPRPRFFTAEIKLKPVTGSNVVSKLGGTIVFGTLARSGTTVTSTNGPYTLSVDPGIPPGWHYSLVPGGAPFQIFAFPPSGGEVQKGTATQKPDNKWDGSVSNVPAGFKMLATMGSKDMERPTATTML